MLNHCPPQRMLPCCLGGRVKLAQSCHCHGDTGVRTLSYSPARQVPLGLGYDFAHVLACRLCVTAIKSRDRLAQFGRLVRRASILYIIKRYRLHRVGMATPYGAVRLQVGSL